MPDNPIKTNREWLFNTMSKGGYNVGKDQADFDSLLAKSPENRQWLYDTATKSGINVGKDLSDFEHLMGWDNQSSPTEQNAQAGQQTAESQVAEAQEQSTPETAYNPYHVDIQDFKPNVQFGQQQTQQRQDFTPATSASDVYKTDTTNAITEGSERARSRTSYEMNRDAMLNLPEEEKQKEIEKAAAGKMLDIIEDKQNPVNEEVRQFFPDYHYITESTERFDSFLADYRERNYHLGEIEQKLGEIDKQIDALSRQAEDEKKRLIAEKGARYASRHQPETIQDIQDLRAAKRALERSKKLGEEAKRYEQGDTYFLGNVGRGMKDKFYDNGTWDWGTTELLDARRAMMLKDKIDRGEELTAADRIYLGALAEEAQAQMATHGKQTRGYKAGETTMFMLPFMLEMAANPASEIAKESGKTSARKWTDWIAQTAFFNARSRFGKGVLHYLTKGAAHLRSSMVGGVAMASTTGMGRVGAEYVKSQLGEVIPTVNANGEVEFQGFDDSQVDSKAWAAYKALMKQGIENATEILGAAMPVGKALSMTGRAATASAWKMGYRKTARMLAGLGDNIAPLYNYIKNWPVSHILERGNWNGNIEEWMEEQIGMALDILAGENNFHTGEGGMFNLDNQIDTLLGVGLFGTFVSTAATGSYAYNRHQARKKMAQAERLGTNLFGEEWVGNKKLIEDASPEELARILAIAKVGMTKAESDVLIRYATALQMERAVGLAELAKPRRNPGQPAPLEEQTDDSFTEGAQASTPEEIHEVAQEQKSAEEQLAEADANVLQMIQERMDAGASNTELQQVMESLEAPVRTLAENYIASRAKSQGVAAGAEQRAEQEGQRYSLAVGINEDESNDGDIPMVTTGYYKEQPYYVRSMGGDMAVLADAKGEIIEVPAEEVSGVTTKPIEELVERHTQEAMDAEQRKAEFYLQHNAKTQMDVQPNMVLQNGNVQLIVTGVEGNEVTVVPATYDAEQGGIVPKSGESAQNISLEEAYQLQDRYYDSIDNNNTLQAQADAQQPSVAGADADIRADVADTGAGTDGNVGSGTSQAEATGEVAYPTDKQGHTDYTAIEDPEMMASAAQEEFGTSAPEFLDAEIAEAQAVIDNPKSTNVERFRARKRISMLNGAKSILAPEAAQTAAEEPRYSVSDDSQQQIPTPEEIEAEAKRRRSEEGHRKIEAMKKDIETLSKALGVKIDYEEGLYEREGCNGKINGTRITLDPAFPEKSLEFLLGHELTHRMQDLSPELYQQFKMTVINVCPDFAQRREKIRSLYERAGFKVGNKIPYNWDGKRQISLEQIDDEAIADYVGERYQMAEGLDEFITAMQQPTILRKLMEFANWVLEKLTSLDNRPILHMQTTLNRAFFNAAAANAAEAQAKAESKPTQQAEPQQTETEEAKEEEQKPAQENKNKRKDNAKKRKKRKGKRYSIATAEEIQQMVDKEGLTEDEANTLADHGLIMDGGIVMDMDSYDLKQETGYKTPNELTDLEEEEVRFSLGTSGKWKEQFLGDNPTERQKVIAEAVMSWYDRAAADDAINGIISKREYPGGDLNKDGKGALRKNVEYVYTFDLDTTCPRTLQYLAYVQKIEREIGRFLSQKEKVILNEMMRAYGQQMPCVYCYAENKRQALTQYFLDFIAYRNNVLNATSEKEARDKMYGHNSKGNLSEAAEKVLAKWRDDSVSLNSYRPTMEQLYKDYMEARDSVLVYLDYLKGKGEIDENMSDKNIAKKVLERYGINFGKDASADEKNMASTINTIVNDWRYDELEGSSHKKYDEGHIHVWITSRGKNSFALWNEMTKYGKSASGAHNSVKYYPYTSELLDIPEEQKAYINGMSGLRMHSSNDFRIEYVGDYLQLIADMDKGGWMGHTYTKNPMFVKIFGNTGYMINMSIAGYDINGKVVENSDEGMAWDDVKELRRQFPNAGAMFMTTSSLQLDYAINADWVDMIIPFHNSGLPKAIWYDMRKWEDAQNKQNEKLYSTADKKAMLKEAGVKIPKGAKADAINQLFDDHFKPKKIYDNTKEMKEELWDAGVGIPTNSSYQDIKNLYIETFGHECEALGTRKTPHFLPYDTWVGGTLVPGHNNDAKRYLELCKEYGCHPRFKGIQVHDADGNLVDITEHPNYIRVIKESSRTENAQTPVKFNLDEPSKALVDKTTNKLLTPLEYAFNELQKLAWSGESSSYEKDDMGIVNDFIENVIKWDKEHPDNPRQLDFISKEAREFWNTTRNITKSAAERAAMTEHAAQTEPIPYHPNPETGEMLETPNEEKEAKKKAKSTTKYSLASNLTPNQRKAIQMVNPMAEVESDTHYSISEKTDREYLDAVESGDMEKAQQMVREAAKKAMPDTKVVDEDGNPMVVYHGTEEEFTVFKKNSETGVTNRYNEAPSEYYLFADEESPASDYGDTKGVYLNVGNLLQADSREIIEQIISEEIGYINSIAPADQKIDEDNIAEFIDSYVAGDGRIFAESNQPETVAMESWSAIQNAIADYAQKNGYDGFVFNDSTRGEEHHTYAVFDSNQIKSADPVTYDDSGNVIPLSERFNESNEDIRYSLGGLVGADGNEELMGNQRIAMEMEEAGKDAKTIWAATGWERGKDGKWRFEIPDAITAEFIPRHVETLADIVEAPELFAVYPMLRNYKVEFVNSSTMYGSFNPKTKVLKLDRSSSLAQAGGGFYLLTKMGERTVLHEMQHAIQQIEGFARGGSDTAERLEYLKEKVNDGDKTAAFAIVTRGNSENRLLNLGREELSNVIGYWIGAMGEDERDKRETFKLAKSALDDMTDDEFAPFVKKALRLVRESKKEGDSRYKRLAGEVEAKNVEMRSDMPTEMKRNTPPSVTETVSREDQIVRYSLSTQLDEQYPGWNDGSTKENGGDNTQVTNTKSTYVGIGKWMLDTGQKNKSVLDASSGLGLGTQALREMGIKADDVEPYATSDRLKDNPPTYTSYADIDKQYDVIISNAVLNVIPDDWREGVVKDMAEHTKPGGKMIINVRDAEEAKKTKNKIELEDENELLVLWPNGNYRHYQKFWTQKELEEDMRQMLGDGWKVERATPRNSGLNGKRAVVCTRTEDGGNGARPELTRNQRMAIAMVTGEPLSEEDTRYSIASKDVADASRFFATDYDVVGEKFKNRNGTVIKRGGSYKGEEFPVGKVLSSNDVYVHKDYANDHMKELEEKGKKYLPEGFKYNCLMYNPKSPDIIRFDEAPGFDKEREPFVGRYIKVDTKEGKVIDEGNSKAIWHGKWQWVGNDYKGFDVREAYEWQRRWASTLNEIAKGGSLPAWNKQLEKFGLPVDEAVNGAKDTRYSIASDGTLVGVHNISEAKLNKAINMGGLVNPSLAVVDTDNGQHTEYGEISLIAPSELVDRKTGRNIGTYDRDAYTPIYPPVSYFPNRQSDANEKELTKGLDEELGRLLRSNILDYLSGNIYNSGLEYIFLKEKHPDMLPEDVTFPRKMSTTMKEVSDRFFDGKEPTYEAYREFPEEKRKEFNLFVHGKGQVKADAMERFTEMLNSPKPWMRNLAKRVLTEEMPLAEFDNFVWNLRNDEREAGKLDANGTLRAAIEKVREDKKLASEFEEYQMMTIDNLGYDERIQVGWKADGTRTYRKNTLENVSAYMKKQGRNASSQHWASGAGYLMAKLANNMKSLDSIRKNRGRLTKDADSVNGKLRQRMHEILPLFLEDGNRDMFSNEMNAFGYLEDIIVGGMNPDKVAEDFNRHTGMNLQLTDEQRKELLQLREDVRNMPVRYFETKFERPVTLDEFAAAVVPSTITPRVEKGLRDAGLPVYKYDPETSGSREEVMQKAISQEPNTRFSIAAATAPTFYSNAGHAVEQISQNKATPEQWEAMLRKNGGLKAEEDKWLGLTDWLHEQTGTVTKQQILDYINTNDIEVQDVNYSQYGVDVEELRKNYETAFDVEYSNATYQEEKRLDEEGSNEPLDMDKIHSMALAELDKRAPDLKGIFTIKGGKAVVADQKALDKYVEENGGHETNSMRDNYVTRGLNNNREIALIVPSIEPYTTGDLPEVHFADEYTGGRAVAWIRFGDTYDEGNNRVLVIDEVQSQRHQDARDKGYRDEKDVTALRKEVSSLQEKIASIERKKEEVFSELSKRDDVKAILDEDGYIKNGMVEKYREIVDENEELRNLDSQLDELREWFRERYFKLKDLSGGIPDAPFRNNWQELAMKRMLRYAAENGYDKLAWTYGKQQAKRYGLSSKIDRIAYTVRENGKIDARAYLPNGNYVFLGDNWKEIEREVGKEMAARMKAGEHNGTENLQWGTDSDFNPLMYDYNVIKGEGLEVGGKGMEGFYDKMLPNFIDKYCKRLGTKTHDIVLPRVEEVGRVMHSIDITPEMRDYVLTQGQPRYSIADGDVPAETIEAWDRLARSQRFQLRETMFDYLTAVDKFQEFIAKENNGRVMDYQNAYIAMLALSSRNKAEMDVVDNMLVAPLNQIIKKITGAKARMFGKWDWESGELRRLDMYLKAKHGLERNRDMAVREALAERLEMELSTARNTYTDAKELRAEIEEINKRYRERLDEWYEYVEDERNSGKEWFEMQKDMDRYAEEHFGADLSKDYAGLSGTDKQNPGLFGDVDDWMEEAYRYVLDYETSRQQADIDELWHRIGAISQYSLNKQNQSGLTSAEYVTEQTRRYQFYVPLRGWNADIAQDEYDYIDSRVGDFGNPIKKARGRQSEAGNVMGALLNIAYRSISTGNKNLAMQKFYNLVSQFNTNGLAVINSRWMELVDGEWTEVAPQIPQDATPEEVAGILARFESEMEDKRKNGEAKRIRGKEKMAYKTIGRQKDEHQVRVYIGGEERVITITGNPRIAQALNGLTNPSVAESDDWMEEKNSAIRNFMAGAFTSKNMAFSLRNLSRDTIHANNYAFCMENFEYWWRFTRNQNLMVGNAANMVKMMRLISGYNKAKTPETEDERLFKEFMENGGATGYTYIQQQDELAKELADMLQKHDKSWANPADYARRFFELTEFFGNAAELSNRFAAYKTSRQMGRSVSRAVSDAKEITLNFNRKGAGKQTKGETSLVRKVASMTNFGRRFILFFNANMQGKYQLLRMLEKHPVKTVATRLVAPAVFMGAMMPIINNVILPAVYQLVGAGDGDDGDDDNYFDSLTDHERSSYLCFRLPNKAGWLKIPLPPDITPMTEMGDLIGAAANGSRDLSGMDVTKCTVDMMSPVNINWGSGDNVNWTAVGLSFAPTAVQPIGQAMTNTNYLGRNIYRKSFTSYDTDPEYRKTYRSTSPLLKELSRVANNLGGGTDYTTSDNIMDVNPALVQHFITSYLGGYGTTAVDITNALYSAYTGEDTSMTIQKVPVVSSFVVFGNKDVTKSRIESAYGEVSAIVNKMKDKESNMRAGYKEAEETGDVERAAKTMTEFNRMREGYDYKFYSLNKEVVKFIKKLDKSPETSVLQENLKYQLMKELTQMYRYRKPGRLNAYDTDDGMQITIDTEDKDGNVKSTPVTKVR